MRRRLAVVAGAGALVPQVTAAATAAGDKVKVFALVPLELPPGVEQEQASVSDPAAVFAAIRAFRATHLTLAGAVSLGEGDRQRIGALFGGGAASSSDVALSHLSQRLREFTGADLVGVHEIAPELLAPHGPIAGPQLHEASVATAAFALAAAKRVGAMDLGQAVVVAGQRAIAAEDVAGTRDLLARVRRYGEAGLVSSHSVAPLALGKAAKPDQPLFVDLPAIGPETIEDAASAGIRIIAVEAGRTLLLERSLLVQRAEQLQVTVIGLLTNG